MLVLVCLSQFRGSRDWIWQIKTASDAWHCCSASTIFPEIPEDYFADGMTDELTTNLAKVHSLSVISRSSVMRFKRTDKPLSEIARDLNVDVIVQGSVVHVGNNVRVTAQLIDPATGYHLWADDFDRPQQDVLQLQRYRQRLFRESARRLQMSDTAERHKGGGSSSLRSESQGAFLLESTHRSGHWQGNRAIQCGDSS
jgi:TolB-like protein